MTPEANPFAVLSLVVAPAILTNASSVLVMSTSNRLAWAVDWARELSKQLEGAANFASPEAERRLRELTAAEQRTLLLLRGLRSFYVALGGFASAALVSLLGAVVSPMGALATVQALEDHRGGGGCGRRRGARLRLDAAMPMGQDRSARHLSQANLVRLPVNLGRISLQRPMPPNVTRCQNADGIHGQTGWTHLALDPWELPQVAVKECPGEENQSPGSRGEHSWPRHPIVADGDACLRAGGRHDDHCAA